MAKEAEVLEAEPKVETTVKAEAPKELTPEEKFKAQYEIKDPGSDGEAAIKKLKEEIASKQAAKEKAAAAKAKGKDSGSEEEAAAETEEAEGDSPAAKAEAEVVAEPKEDAGDEIPDELWEQAEALGWEEDEIKDFSTVAELKKAVTLAAKAAARVAPAKAVVEVKQEAKVEAAAEDDIPDLDPEEYDEKMVKGWKAMKARVKAAEEQNAQLAQEQKERSFRELRTRMRGFCDEVKDDYGEINLPKEVEIAGEMDHLLRSGKQFKTEKELFRAAAARVFADQAGANERRKLSRSLNSRSAQTTVRPKGGAVKGGSALKRKIQELKQAGKVDDSDLNEFL